MGRARRRAYTGRSRQFGGDVCAFYQKYMWCRCVLNLVERASVVSCENLNHTHGENCVVELLSHELASPMASSIYHIGTISILITSIIQTILSGNTDATDTQVVLTRRRPAQSRARVCMAVVSKIDSPIGSCASAFTWERTTCEQKHTEK